MRILLSVLLLSLIASGAEKKPLVWQTGTLVDQSVSLEDSGCAGNVCGGTYHRTHYAIESENKLYVANRTGGMLDLTVNQPVKFAVSGNTIYLMNADGKVHDCHLEQERDVAQPPASGVPQPCPSAAEAEGMVALASTPTGADVNVDGNFVGDAPAKLMLKPGNHTIAVSLAGYKVWSRDLTALGGSEVSLTANLEKKD